MTEEYQIPLSPEEERQEILVTRHSYRKERDRFLRIHPEMKHLVKSIDQVERKSMENVGGANIFHPDQIRTRATKVGDELYYLDNSSTQVPDVRNECSITLTITMGRYKLYGNIKYFL